MFLSTAVSILFMCTVFWKKSCYINGKHKYVTLVLTSLWNEMWHLLKCWAKVFPRCETSLALHKAACFCQVLWDISKTVGGFQCSTCICISWVLWYHNLIFNITSWLWEDGARSYLDTDLWETNRTNQTKPNQTEEKSIELCWKQLLKEA